MTKVTVAYLPIAERLPTIFYEGIIITYSEGVRGIRDLSLDTWNSEFVMRIKYHDQG